MTDSIVFEKRIFGTARMSIRFPNVNVLVLATIKGHISKNMLEQAVSEVSKKHLLINSRVRIEEDSNAWFQITNDMKPEVYNSQVSDTINEIMISEFKRPFDLEKGPLIRFNIIAQEEETSLLICCHHSICDGLSLIYLTNDLLKAVSASGMEPCEIKNPVLLDEKIILPKLKSNFLMKIVINSINKKWKNKNLAVTKSGYDEIFTEFWSKQNPGIVRWALSTEQTRKLIEQSKKNNITVNSAIGTSFIRAEGEVLDKKDYSNDITISVSFRNYLEANPGDAMGAFSSAVRLRLNYDAANSFWVNAINFHKQIKSLIIEKNLFESQMIGLLNPKFLDAMALGKYGKCDDSTVKKMIEKKKMNDINTSFILTNLGKIKLNCDCPEYQLSNIMGPAVYGDTMEKYIGVLTINDQMYFSITFNQNIISKERMENLKSMFIQIVDSI